MENIITPVKAIRLRCLECMNGQPKEVSLCSGGCALSPFRFGTRGEKGSVVKKIREHCLGCSESASTVRKCPFEDCPLFPYRMGHNPSRKGMGNIKTLRKKLDSETASWVRKFSEKRGFKTTSCIVKAGSCNPTQSKDWNAVSIWR